MRIAVFGGTGTIGRLVVDAARAAGHDVVIASRRTGVDVLTGSGLRAALTGVHSVVDVTNTPAAGRRAATGFFERATAALVEHGRAAGVAHHVVLSIVGVDRIGWGYYRAKLRQEEIALAGPVAASVLRSTQFHEFVGQTVDRYRGVPSPVAVVPRMRIQPIAASEVAESLLELATGRPRGRADDLAGSEVLELTDLARQLLRARRTPAWVLPVRVPGRLGRQLAEGAALPTAAGPRGRQTFSQWLAQAYPATPT